MNALSALEALDVGGVAYVLRNGLRDVESADAKGDIDVVVGPNDLAKAESLLKQAGLQQYRVSGHPGHRFWLGWQGAGSWLKIDLMTTVRYPGGASVPATELLSRRQRRSGVWVAGGDDVEFHRAMRAKFGKQPSSPISALTMKLRRRRPVGLRRRGPLLAVLGPDGAGKSTIVEQCLNTLPIGVTVKYLGLGTGKFATQRSAEATAPSAAQHRPGQTSLPNPLRECAYLTRNALRWWTRLGSAYATAWTGRPVLCDRHPLELIAIKPLRTPAGARLERVLFDVLMPKPDAIVLLDAPGEVMFARKGEHDAASLERQRQDLRAAFIPRGAFVISTAGELATSAAELSDLLHDRLGIRQRWDAHKNVGFPC